MTQIKAVYLTVANYRRRERHTVGLKVLGRPRSEGRKRGVLPRNKSHARSEMGRVGRAIQGESNLMINLQVKT